VPHAAETCIGNRPQETSVTIAAKTPYPQDLTKDSKGSVGKEAKDEDTDKDYLGHHLHQDRDSLPAGPDQGCDGKEAKDEDSDNDYTIDTIDTDNDYTIDTDNDYTIDDTALQPPEPTTPDHDYISDDRNDDFDAVHCNHAFDNDFDLDMHEPRD
jgi:hypothetical protein